MGVLFFATITKNGWRVQADWTGCGGSIVDICGAVNETVARGVALSMNTAVHQ